MKRWAIIFLDAVDVTQFAMEMNIKKENVGFSDCAMYKMSITMAFPDEIRKLKRSEAKMTNIHCMCDNKMKCHYEMTMENLFKEKWN